MCFREGKEFTLFFVPEVSEKKTQNKTGLSSLTQMPPASVLL